MPYWVNCGIYVLSAGRDRALSREGRPRDDDLPGARRRGLAARVSAHGPLAHRQHAQGAAPCGRARHPASRMARVTTPYRLRPSPRRQALGLRADLGRDRAPTSARCCSSAPARRSASSTTSRRTSPGSSRAGGRRSSSGRSAASSRRTRSWPGDCFRYRPGHRPPGHGDRGHDDPRGLDAASRRRRAARRPLRPARARRVSVGPA